MTDAVADMTFLVGPWYLLFRHGLCVCCRDWHFHLGCLGFLGRTLRVAWKFYLSNDHAE